MSIFINIFLVSLMVGGAIGWFWSQWALRKRQNELCQYYDLFSDRQDMWRQMVDLPKSLKIHTITMEELEELAKAEEAEK